MIFSSSRYIFQDCRMTIIIVRDKAYVVLYVVEQNPIYLLLIQSEETKLISALATEPSIYSPFKMSSKFNKTVKRILSDSMLSWMLLYGVFTENHTRARISLIISSPLQLICYMDLNWSSFSMTRCSITGFISLLGNSPIIWKTNKQVIVSHSSIETEYRLMATASCDVTQLNYLLTALGMCYHCDNQAASHIAANPVFHEHPTHIEPDYHIAREYFPIRFKSHVPTNEQLLDLFTKIIGRDHSVLLSPSRVLSIKLSNFRQSVR